MPLIALGSPLGFELGLQDATRKNNFSVYFRPRLNSYTSSEDSLMSLLPRLPSKRTRNHRKKIGFQKSFFTSLKNHSTHSYVFSTLEIAFAKPKRQRNHNVKPLIHSGSPLGIELGLQDAPRKNCFPVFFRPRLNSYTSFEDSLMSLLPRITPNGPEITSLKNHSTHSYVFSTLEIEFAKPKS